MKVSKNGIQIIFAIVVLNFIFFNNLYTEENLTKYVDPFIGSGTTAISCIDHNRNYIGIEIHEEYVRMAKERIARHTPLKKFL